MEYLPETKISTVFLQSLAQGVSTRKTIMLGTANSGIIDELTPITGESDFANKFGSDDNTGGLTGVKAVKQFFSNFGSGLQFKRVAGSGSTKATLSVESGDVVFDAITEGTLGNKYTVEIDAVSGIVTVKFGNSVEIYTGVVKNSDLVTKLSVSKWVNVTVRSGAVDNLVRPFTTTQLAGGTDRAPSETEILTAVDSLNLVDYDVLLIPGQTTDAFHNTIVGKLIVRADLEKKFSQYYTGITLAEDFSVSEARTANGEMISRLALGCDYTNKSNSNAVEHLDASYSACGYAGMVTFYGLGVSTTMKEFKNEGIEKSLTKLEQDNYLSIGLIPFGKYQNVFKVSRAITSFSDKTSPAFEQVITDIVYSVKQLLQNYSDEQILGSPDSTKNRIKHAMSMDNILSGLVSNELLKAFLPTQSEDVDGADAVKWIVKIAPFYAVNKSYITLEVN